MIAVLIATLVAGAAPYDTVYTSDGSQVVGTVLEQSPTAGVTVQAPDGALRQLPAAQVARIEFADGTSSALRPAPAASPAAPAPAAAPASEASPGPPPVAAPVVPGRQGPLDTVFFAGGGRVRGQVIREDAKAGVTLRLLDGSLRTLAPEEFTRIEYADGTVSRRKPPESAPAPPPSARPEPAPAAPLDSVYFLAGGRVRGTVIEEHPVTGVRIRQLDGMLRTYPREELARIEYADGTVSRRKGPVPQGPPASPPPGGPNPPPPSAQPPPFVPVHEHVHPLPLYLTLGVGVTFVGGDAERGLPMDRLFNTQGHLSSELGLRFSPSFALGLYGDAGGGDVAAPVRDACLAVGQSCTGMTGRIGLLARYTWDPLEAHAKWLSIGTGWEVGEAVPDHQGQGTSLFTYSGREYLRLGAGIDFRSSQALGLGLYASFAWGEFDRYEDSAGVIALARATHTTAQVGVRLILFP